MDNHKDYQNLIIKDIKAEARDGYRGPFLLGEEYPMGSDTDDVFLLGGVQGKWASIAKDLKKDSKKFAFGECQIVSRKDGIKVVIRNSKGIGPGQAAKAINIIVKKGGINSLELKQIPELIAEESHKAAGKEFKLDAGAKKQLLKVNIEVGEYKKFATAFDKFTKRYDIKGAGKLPVIIWSELLLGIIKKGELLGDLIDKGDKDMTTGRLMLAYKGPNGKRIRQKMLQESMDGLQKFVDHAAGYLDKVIAKVAKGSTWCFWSGTGGQDMAKKLNASGVVLEGTVGSWFDEVWDFKSMTGFSNFQLWTALSEMYAKKAAENYEKFSFRGYLGPGSTTEQNVFNQIESPTFVEVLGKKAVIKKPEIEWFVVHCTDTTGRWKLDTSVNNGIVASYTDRKKALAKVKELYGK